MTNEIPNQPPAFLSLFAETFRTPESVADYLKAHPMACKRCLEFMSLVILLNFIHTKIIMDWGIMTSQIMRQIPETQQILMGVLFFPLSVFAVHYGGRLFDGVGSLAQTILLMSWVNLALICLQFIQIAVLFVFPLIAPLLSFVIFFYFVRLNLCFIMRLHGFTSPPMTLLVSVFGLIAVMAFLMYFLTLFGGMETITIKGIGI